MSAEHIQGRLEYGEDCDSEWWTSSGWRNHHGLFEPRTVFTHWRPAPAEPEAPQPAKCKPLTTEEKVEIQVQAFGPEN